MSKEKQIEEIAKFICNACEMGGGFEGECCLDNDYKTCYSSKITACAIYNAGYRKQSEGEWVQTKNMFGFGQSNCSRCNGYVDGYTSYRFCPHCGAKIMGIVDKVIDDA